MKTGHLDRKSCASLCRLALKKASNKRRETDIDGNFLVVIAFIKAMASSPVPDFDTNSKNGSM
jgi:hypothetical protein